VLHYDQGYVSFLHRVREDYPSALIATLCQPMNRDPQCANTQKATAQAGVSAHYIKMPKFLVPRYANIISIIDIILYSSL
jgi:hypothetical protein